LGLVSNALDLLSSPKTDQKRSIAILKSVSMLLQRRDCSFKELEESFYCLKKLADSDNVRVARVSAWILGSLVSCVEDSTRLKTVGASDAGERDPVDFKRLDSDVSFLRAVYENLQICTDVGMILEMVKYWIDKATIMLDALVAVKVPIPLVDWSRILTKVALLSDDLYLLVFEFSSKNAILPKSASSFSEIFVNLMTGSCLHDTSGFETRAGFIVSRRGIGSLLALGGVSKGEVGKIRVSASRVLDIVRGVLWWLTDSCRQSDTVIFSMDF
jgi:hypothetical protein